MRNMKFMLLTVAVIFVFQVGWIRHVAGQAAVNGSSAVQSPDAPTFDSRLALDLLNASIQTYRVYANMPVVAPDGWIYSGQTFEGDDFFVDTVSKKSFGVIMQKKDEPGGLLVAFRGTDSTEEWWDDLTVKQVEFKPQSSKVQLPAGLLVEEGFHRVYQSMKDELFEIVDGSKAQTVYVTGHSLGAAVSTLFAFDLQLCRPNVTVVSYNFASPKVGNEAFVAKFQSLPGQAKKPLIRFVNSKDLVPKVPLNAEGFVHLPDVYDIHFEQESLLPSAEVCHSADNYYRVLQEALKLDNVNAELFKTKPDPIKILPSSP